MPLSAHLSDSEMVYPFHGSTICLVLSVAKVTHHALPDAPGLYAGSSTRPLQLLKPDLLANSNEATSPKPASATRMKRFGLFCSYS